MTPFNGTVHVGTADDFNELADLYRCTYRAGIWGERKFFPWLG
jgi:hypothetical protein